MSYGYDTLDEWYERFVDQIKVDDVSGACTPETAAEVVTNIFKAMSEAYGAGVSEATADHGEELMWIAEELESWFRDVGLAPDQAEQFQKVLETTRLKGGPRKGGVKRIVVELDKDDEGLDTAWLESRIAGFAGVTKVRTMSA